ncbi:hypothetical protein [Methanoculleus chikugoensis]|uniref:Uncharacterized protein n=1 Tax=Methanoculleus chikugoensis TaxID=118126 RepID=A0ABN5XGK1_9EURY|nr:hypothetical protein [Methanoculleus chikugoensis]BBL67609.1 hypothetical protein MchiMG62_07900 [Methanoculleus chikugoensis]
MAREYPPLLIAVIICVLMTVLAGTYALLASEGAPPPKEPALPPAPAGTPGTPVATGAPVQVASRTFSISVTPSSATARPGDTVRFTLTVHPEDGFAAPIEVNVTATALGGVYRDNHDLGTISVPYPPLTYEVAAPDLPPLVSTATVDAVVTATGGGTVRTERVQLVIRR